MPIAGDLDDAWICGQSESPLLNAGDECFDADSGDDIFPLPHARVWIERVYTLPRQADFFRHFEPGSGEELLHAADLRYDGIHLVPP